MKIDTLHFGTEVYAKLLAGITKCADIVGSTMGAGGANVVIEAIESPGHLVTNDGATILEHIHFVDPLENMGKNILMESVRRANKQSGDGSSTTTVLTRAILKEGESFFDVPKMDIKRSLEDCIPEIEKIIAEIKKDITVEEVGMVATVAAEDETIGNTIQEIYTKIGKDGIIYWDLSKTTEDSYVIGSGITVEDSGFYSPYMCDITTNGQTTNQIKIKNPVVIITKQKISKAQEFNQIAMLLHGDGVSDVVVFCDEIDPLVIPDLLKTRMEKGFRIILVKVPTLWKDEWYEDLAMTSGATVIDPSGGKFIKDITKHDTGTFDNIIITKESVFIDGIKNIDEHLEKLKEEGTDIADNRIARLNTKTARLYLGAHSDSALSYKRLKVEDAISAAYHALQNGIVSGGGVALMNAARRMPLTAGGGILHQALQAPFKQIIKNANQEASSALFQDNWGINIKTGEEVNMFEAGIVDPANVVLNAAKNAISVAATILTTNALITLPRE